jgi:transposase-like protein
MWYVVNQKSGVSACGLQKALGFGSYHTAWEWLHKLRRAMVRPNRDKLSGIVEINEIFVGGERSGKRGRGADGKTLVLIAAENKEGKIGRIRLLPICNASGAILTDAVMQMVSIGSEIRTDGWNGYNDLSSNGYIHLSSCNDNIKAIDTIPMPHLVAALLKRWLLGIHQGAINHKNLPYYLDEFTFRFNRRTSRSRGKLFHRLVQQALNLEPVPAKLLATQIVDNGAESTS